MAVKLRRQIRSEARRAAAARMRAARRELRAEMERHGRAVKREFEDIVSDWKPEHRPQFTVERKLSARELRVVVRPYKRRKASRIFGWVDRGTRSYTIRPKRRNKRGRLAFRTGYAPRTQPVARAHVGPGKASGPWVMPKKVRHPGIRARKFSESIGKRTEKAFRRRIENVFRRMARR